MMAFCVLACEVACLIVCRVVRLLACLPRVGLFELAFSSV